MALSYSAIAFQLFARLLVLPLRRADHDEWPRRDPGLPFCGRPAWPRSWLADNRGLGVPVRVSSRRQSRRLPFRSGRSLPTADRARGTHRQLLGFMRMTVSRSKRALAWSPLLDEQVSSPGHAVLERGSSESSPCSLQLPCQLSFLHSQIIPRKKCAYGFLGSSRIACSEVGKRFFRFDLFLPGRGRVPCMARNSRDQIESRCQRL